VPITEFMENVKIKNSAGQNLAAVIHYPQSPTSRLAILCPGYLDSKDYDHLVNLAEALATAGYTVVRFDPTGAWASEGPISDYTTSQYLADVKSVLQYMLLGHDYKNILLGGHSRGGMVSILYAATDPRISAVLAIMPPSGHFTGAMREEWKRKSFRITRRDIPGKKEMREFRVPYSHAEDRDKFDVVKDVKKLHIPIVFIAGELDDIVLPRDVREIFDQANEPKKYIMIKGIGHDYRYSLAEIKMVDDEVMKAIANLT